VNQACSFLHGAQAGPQQATQHGYAIADDQAANDQAYIGDYTLPEAAKLARLITSIILGGNQLRKRYNP